MASHGRRRFTLLLGLAPAVAAGQGSGLGPAPVAASPAPAGASGTAAGEAGLPTAPATGGASAAGWPDRPIKVVVNFPPGGAADQIARVVGKPLQDRLGQPVVIDNRGGSGGNVGGEIVARALPDGYTLLMSSGGMVSVNPLIYRAMSFDPILSVPAGRSCRRPPPA